MLRHMAYAASQPGQHSLTAGDGQCRSTGIPLASAMLSLPDNKSDEIRAIHACAPPNRGPHTGRGSVFAVAACLDAVDQLSKGQIWRWIGAVLTTCRQYLVGMGRAQIEADRAHGTEAYSSESAPKTANFSGRLHETASRPVLWRFLCSIEMRLRETGPHVQYCRLLKCCLQFRRLRAQ